MVTMASIRAELVALGEALRVLSGDAVGRRVLGLLTHPVARDTCWISAATLHAAAMAATYGPGARGRR